MLILRKIINTTFRFTTVNARNEMPVFCHHISSSLHSIRTFSVLRKLRTEYDNSLRNCTNAVSNLSIGYEDKSSSYLYM